MRTAKPFTRTLSLCALVCALLGGLPLAAQARGAGSEWESLNQEVETLYRAGQYDRAARLARKALKVAEQNVGPNHPYVATSLNNLALLYKTQGHHTQAEPLMKRALAIREKALGPDHPAVATSLNNLAALYKTQGHYTQAEPLYQRAGDQGEGAWPRPS